MNINILCGFFAATLFCHSWATHTCVQRYFGEILEVWSPLLTPGFTPSRSYPLFSRIFWGHARGFPWLFRFVLPWVFVGMSAAFFRFVRPTPFMRSRLIGISARLSRVSPISMIPTSTIASPWPRVIFRRRRVKDRPEGTETVWIRIFPGIAFLSLPVRNTTRFIFRVFTRLKVHVYNAAFAWSSDVDGGLWFLLSRPVIGPRPTIVGLVHFRLLWAHIPSSFLSVPWVRLHRRNAANIINNNFVILSSKL